MFDGEILDKIILRDKRLQKFKADRLNIDNQLYKEAKINAQKHIKNKKRDLCPEKLREYIGKPKELWESLKSLGLPRITQDNPRLSSFSPTLEDEILELLQIIKNTADIDNLSGRFLKDTAVVLALPIPKLCNLSMKVSKFPLDYKNCQTQTIIQERFKNRSKKLSPRFTFATYFESYRKSYS